MYKGTSHPRIINQQPVSVDYFLSTRLKSKDLQRKHTLLNSKQPKAFPALIFSERYSMKSMPLFKTTD